MSVKPIQNNLIDKFGRRTENISTKDYEKIVFNNLQHHITEEENRDITVDVDNSNPSKLRHFKNKFLQVLQPYIKSKVETQLEVFQSSMKYCLVIGQCLGLFPIINVTERDTQKKFSILSWRYSICFTILLVQIITTVLTGYRMLTSKFSVSTASDCIFFVTNLILNVQFIRLSTKWHHLMKLVATSKLDEYVDPYVKFKCNFATIFFLTFALIEHAIILLSPFLKIRECSSDVADAVKKASLIACSWLFEVIVPYSHGIMVTVEFFVMIISMIWTYCDVFIICVSLFLTSILDGFNKKIISRDNQFLPASCWRAMRQDYNRIIRLVRFFDDDINGIVFISFGNNLFFICFRLYYLLGEGFVYGSYDDYKCLHLNERYGFEDLIYNLTSAVFLITRTISVSYIAAKIHTASLEVAPSLYNIPSSAFCTEVQRFLEQIHGTTVALTGLKFFYVTKELILSIIGTVVTYELVLLQFK